jgi:hypothetical protein
MSRLCHLLGLCLATLPAGLWADGERVRTPAWAEEGRMLSTAHFKVYHEDPFVPAGILGTLEGLYAKISLELGPFAPWAADQGVTVYLYRDAESYHQNPEAPRWSVAYVSYADRRVHVYPDPDFQRNMAHELAHLFFTSFFYEKQQWPPVWLNEGVARLMEWDYGLSGEDVHVRRSLTRTEAMPLPDLFAAAYQHNGDQSSRGVSLYYSQSYSVTKFLMRRFSQAQFITFCGALRDKKSVDEGLKAAYGFLVPDTVALERLWRDSLGEN